MQTRVVVSVAVPVPHDIAKIVYSIVNYMPNLSLLDNPFGRRASFQDGLCNCILSSSDEETGKNPWGFQNSELNDGLEISLNALAHKVVNNNSRHKSTKDFACNIGE